MEMKKLKRIRQFAFALAMAIWHGCARGSFAECRERSGGFFTALWSGRNLPEVSRLEWFTRMHKCLRCPVFDRKRFTCGTPGDENKCFLDQDGQLQPMGCYCFMPVKAKLAGATCWLADFQQREGWGT